MHVLKCSRRICCAILLGAMVAGLEGIARAQAGPGRPSNLRTEYLIDPIGIDVAQPRFFWLLDHSQRGEVQSGYQIQVGSQRQTLEGDQWGSGRISSPDFNQVVYNGKPLASDLLLEGTVLG